MSKLDKLPEGIQLHLLRRFNKKEAEIAAYGYQLRVVEEEREYPTDEVKQEEETFNNDMHHNHINIK